GVGIADAAGGLAVIVDGAEQVIVARLPIVLRHGDAHPHLAGALGAACRGLAVVAGPAFVHGHGGAALAGDAHAHSALAVEDRAVDRRPFEALSAAARAGERACIHVVTLGAVVAWRRGASVVGLVAGADMTGVRRRAVLGGAPDADAAHA